MVDVTVTFLESGRKTVVDFSSIFLESCKDPVVDFTATFLESGKGSNFSSIFLESCRYPVVDFTATFLESGREIEVDIPLFSCVVLPLQNVYKSANRLYISEPKVELYHL